MWICQADGHYHYDSLDYTRKGSIQKEVEYAQKVIQPDFMWPNLQEWGFQCVKVKVTIE